MNRVVIPVLLVLGAAALYLPWLGDAPIFASHDEIVYSLQAHHLATTGRDLSGRFMPMYIEYSAQFGRPTWDQPMLIYLIAATLKVLPFSEFAIRLPMALAAILDVLLIYFVARTLFESERYAIAAAALLALTPAHFMHSRQAIDFQLSLPFILGWLLCLVHYLRNGDRRLLFAGGAILGVSLFGYVASYVLVPILAVSTIAVAWWHGGRGASLGWFLAGIAAPCLLCLPWMLRFQLPFRDVVAHYTVLNGSAAENAGLTDVVKDFVLSSRLREIPGLYASFFNPDFLFISGPMRFRATQLVGVFLVGVAGAILVGLVHAFRRRSIDDVLLLIGLLTGPLVASLGGEGQAVWRTLQLAVFGSLLAVVALRYVQTLDSVVSRTAFVVLFAMPIALASWHHDFLPHAQALVRAATVPLAVAGLAVLLRRLDLERVGVVRAAVMSVVVLGVMYLAYFAIDHATTVGMILIAVLAVAVVSGRMPDRVEREPLVSFALLVFVVGQFMYLYVDYGQVRRIGPIPASALVLALRLAAASIALLAVVWLARVVKVSGSARGELVEPRAAVLVAIWLIGAQAAYYWVDATTDFRLRALHVAVVIAAVVGLAVAVRAAVENRTNIGRLAMAGLFGLVSLQFGAFYVDYLAEFQKRGSAEVEGNMRGAFESVIERTRERNVPAIYLGKIGPYYYGEWFWKFYLVKHHREDLLARTIAEMEFKPDRVRALPPGSVVITSPTRQVTEDLERLTAGGVFSDRQLLKAPDGAPIFWILERANP